MIVLVFYWWILNGGGVVGDEETYDDETYELPPSFALGASPEGEFEKYIIAIRSTIANFEKIQLDMIVLQKNTIWYCNWIILCVR